jgi:DNA-binding MarR family transcriptional regulator
MSGSSAERLADGLHELMGHLMKTSRGEVFRLVMEMDLSMTQVRTLFLVDAAARPPALHELAADLGLSLAGTGRAVDVLVRHGLTGRHEDPADRRVKRITLTPAGEQIVRRITSARREDMRRFAERLTEQERTALAGALAPILARPDLRAPHDRKHC